MTAQVRSFTDAALRAGRSFAAADALATAVDRISSFAVAFEQGAVFGRAVPTDDGWAYEWSPALRALFDAVESTGFLVPSDPHVDLDELAARLPRADLSELRRALSGLLRAERRAPGSLAEPVARGVLSAIFRRLEALRAAMGPRGVVAVAPPASTRRRRPEPVLRVSSRPAPSIRAETPSASGAERGLLARPGADAGDATAILADLLVGLAAWDGTPRLGDARFLVLAVEEGEAPSFVQVLSDPTQHGLLIEVDSGFFEPEGAWRATADQRARAVERGFSDGTRSNFARVAFVGGFQDAERLACELIDVLEDLCGWSPGAPIELVVHRGAEAPEAHAALTAGDVEEVLRRSGLGAHVGRPTKEDAPVDDDVAVVRSATRGVAFAAVLSDRVDGPLPRYRHLRLQARFPGLFPPAAAERFNAETPAGRATRDGHAFQVALDLPLEGGVTEPALTAAVARFALLAQAARLFVARCQLRPSKLGVLRQAHFKPKVQELERRLLRFVVPGRVEDVVQELAEVRADAGVPLATALNAEIRRIVKEHQDWTWVKDLTSPGGVDGSEVASILGVLGGPVVRVLVDGLVEIEHPCRDMRVVIDPRHVRQVSFSARPDHAHHAMVRLRDGGRDRRFVVTPDDIGFAPVAGEDIELRGVRVAVRIPAELVTTGEVAARLVAVERGMVWDDLDRVLAGCGELAACLLGARAAGLEVPMLEARLGAILSSLGLRGGLRPIGG